MSQRYCFCSWCAEHNACGATEAWQTYWMKHICRWHGTHNVGAAGDQSETSDARAPCAHFSNFGLSLATTPAWRSALHVGEFDWGFGHGKWEQGDRVHSRPQHGLGQDSAGPLKLPFASMVTCMFLLVATVMLCIKLTAIEKHKIRIPLFLTSFMFIPVTLTFRLLCQVITLLHTMLTRFSPKNKDKYGAGAPSLRTALILTPVNIIYNWYASMLSTRRSFLTKSHLAIHHLLFWQQMSNNQNGSTPHMYWTALQRVSGFIFWNGVVSLASPNVYGILSHLCNE